MTTVLLRRLVPVVKLMVYGKYLPRHVGGFIQADPDMKSIG